MLLLGVGWGLVAGFLLPPISPTKGAGEIAALIANDATRIRIGMVIGMFSALLFIPFAGVVAEYLARVEGGAGMLTYSFLLGSAANMVLSFYPEIWWLVAAFRPDRSPDAIHLMNDLAWLQLLGGVTIYLAMPLSVAVAAFLDESNTPVFPRWSGYANLFLTLLILPDQMIFFFHQGPFAWDGLFGLWLPVTAFAAKPKPRYRVGMDAKVVCLLADLLPARWMDVVMGQSLNNKPL
ncbi:MAG TPA: hypothetical protein VFY35_02965 [Burkholderiaceae bacterium]|nr:hypothetical protein [Burkholderiaceae bacterium]